MVKLKLAWTIFLGILGLAVAAFAAEPAATSRAAQPAFTAERLTAHAAARASSWKDFPSIHLGAASWEESTWRLASMGQLSGTATPVLPQEDEKKLPGRGAVFFKSLLLPGWGQHSLGANTSARTFLVAEAVLWGLVIGSNLHGKYLAEDYKDMAAGHASVRGSGKDSRYWVDIGNFNSIFDYNQEKLQQRSVADLRDPESEDFWYWDSPDNRRSYENLRVRSDAAYERGSFAIAAVITNHIISAIHAMWVHRKRSGAIKKQEAKQDLGVRMFPNARGGEVSWSVKF